jgi:hypothetical protein
MPFNIFLHFCQLISFALMVAMTIGVLVPWQAMSTLGKQPAGPLPCVFFLVVLFVKFDVGLVVRGTRARGGCVNAFEGASAGLAPKRRHGSDGHGHSSQNLSQRHRSDMSDAVRIFFGY